MASDASQATSGSAALPSRPEATVPLHEKSKNRRLLLLEKAVAQKNGKTACCFFRETGDKNGIYIVGAVRTYRLTGTTARALSPPV